MLEERSGRRVTVMLEERHGERETASHMPKFGGAILDIVEMMKS